MTIFYAWDYTSTMETQEAFEYTPQQAAQMGVAKLIEAFPEDKEQIEQPVTEISGRGIITKAKWNSNSEPFNR